MLITLEGIDGCGKSSMLRMLKDSSDLPEGTIFTKQPGGDDPTCVSIRQLLLDNSKDIDPVAELLLFYADRRQHLQKVIRPQLDKNGWVVCDRYEASTIAYQLSGRELPVPFYKLLDIREIINYRRPDLTILFDVQPEIGLKRAAKVKKGLDRMEQGGIDFLKRVRKGFLDLAERNDYIHVIGTDNLTLEEQYKKTMDLISKKLL